MPTEKKTQTTTDLFFDELDGLVGVHVVVGASDALIELVCLRVVTERAAAAIICGVKRRRRRIKN